MDRINRILYHTQYQLYVEKNRVAEADRSFCHHNMAHFMDVARIAMLINLQDKMQIQKDMIYAAAFLHDIGRFVEYEGNGPHDIAGAEIAKELLPQCGFSDRETEIVAEAIMGHRRKQDMDQEIGTLREHTDAPWEKLGTLLKHADKMSRNCRWCPAKEACNWSSEEKNRAIEW